MQKPYVFSYETETITGYFGASVDAMLRHDSQPESSPERGHVTGIDSEQRKDDNLA